MTRLQLTCSVVCMLAAGALSACDSGPVPIDKGKISGAIKDDVHEMVAAFNTKDADKVVTHDAPDIVFMFHGQPNVVGVAADLESTKQLVSDPRAYIQLGNETVDVADSGEMAVYRTVYRFTSTDPKTKADTVERGNWVVGYKLIDGKWKIAWNVVSDTGPAPKEPGAAN